MTNKAISVFELSQNEISIVSGGARCFYNSAYKWATKTSHAAATAYCLLVPQPIRGINRINAFLHNRMNIPIEVAQKTVCAAIINTIMETVDYCVGDWFECDKEEDKS